MKKFRRKNKDNKKIFSIGTELIEYADFLWWAVKYKVYVK